MITFRYADDEGTLAVTAMIGDWPAGSVIIREYGSRQVSVGRLHVDPAWRGQHVARRIMAHVLEMFPRADKWLYAEPFTREKGERPGPPREVLVRFYESLGFVHAADAEGRPAMVYRIDRTRGCR